MAHNGTHPPQPAIIKQPYNCLTPAHVNGYQKHAANRYQEQGTPLPVNKHIVTQSHGNGYNHNVTPSHVNGYKHNVTQSHGNGYNHNVTQHAQSHVNGCSTLGLSRKDMNTPSALGSPSGATNHDDMETSIDIPYAHRNIGNICSELMDRLNKIVEDARVESFCRHVDSICGEFMDRLHETVEYANMDSFYDNVGSLWDNFIGILYTTVEEAGMHRVLDTLRSTLHEFVQKMQDSVVDILARGSYHQPDMEAQLHIECHQEGTVTSNPPKADVVPPREQLGGNKLIVPMDEQARHPFAPLKETNFTSKRSVARREAHIRTSYSTPGGHSKPTPVHNDLRKNLLAEFDSASDAQTECQSNDAVSTVGTDYTDSSSSEWSVLDQQQTNTVQPCHVGDHETRKTDHQRRLKQGSYMANSRHRKSHVKHPTANKSQGKVHDCLANQKLYDDSYGKAFRAVVAVHWEYHNRRKNCQGAGSNLNQKWLA